MEQGAEWITAPLPWGERAAVRAEELGEWIAAPEPLDKGLHELSVFFTVPENQGVTAAYLVGAVRSSETFALVAINGSTGYAGGEIQTFGPDYPCFEGDISSWILPGLNRLALRVRPGKAVPACSVRLQIQYATGKNQEIITDGRWQAIPVPTVSANSSGNGEIARRPDPKGNDGGKPVQSVAPRGSEDGIARKRLFSTPLPAPHLRRAFTLPAPVRRASLTVCGLGYYEAYLNGERIGDHVLDPAQTAYPIRAFSVTYDVTEKVKKGKNALGLLVGHGWYSQNRAWLPAGMAYGKPGAIAWLEIYCTDGTTQKIVTNADWRAADGAIREDSVYGGEVYDARLERINWTRPDYDDRSWKPAEVLSPLSARLEPQPMPPMRRIREVTPVAIKEVKPGLWIFDMGENIVGWARLSVTAPAGTRIRLRFGEIQRPDSTLEYNSTGVGATRVLQTDEYICKGKGKEIWEPRFTYHGFQYVEVSGLPEPPTKGTITGIVVHSDLATVGSFACGNATLNQIEKLSRRSLVGNLHGIVTDCPHRERCQWHGDAEVIADYALYAVDAAPLLAKMTDDASAPLDPDGLPMTIGVGRRTFGFADIGWSTIIIQVPWRLYLYRGDLEPARRHYDRMRHLIDTLRKRHPDSIVPGAAFGDHAATSMTHQGASIASCPKDGYATILFYEATLTLAKIAQALGRTEDAANYRNAAESIHTAFVARFFDSATGGYPHPTLDAYALLLDVYPQDKHAILTQHFHDTLANRGYMNIGGFFGYRRIAEAAVRFLPEEAALSLLTQDREPGIPYSLRYGATSLWEFYVPPQHPMFYERSRNHFAFGSVCEVFWRHLAGIAPDETTPGFRQIHLAPHLTHVLPSVTATYRAPTGRIQSTWHRKEGVFLWDITVPSGSEGRAVVPMDSRTAQVTIGDTLILAGGQVKAEVSGVTVEKVEASSLTVRLSTGFHCLAVF